MKITIDRPALRQLIDQDPVFELELKAAVLSEIGKRFFEKDAANIIRQTEPILFAKALEAVQSDADLAHRVNLVLEKSITSRTASWSSRIALTDNTKKAIKDQVDALREQTISHAALSVNELFTEHLKIQVENFFADVNIKSRIQRILDRLTNEEIERRAKEHFNTLKAKIESALS